MSTGYWVTARNELGARVVAAQLHEDHFGLEPHGPRSETHGDDREGIDEHDHSERFRCPPEHFAGLVVSSRKRYCPRCKAAKEVARQHARCVRKWR